VMPALARGGATGALGQHAAATMAGGMPLPVPRREMSASGLRRAFCYLDKLEQFVEVSGSQIAPQSTRTFHSPQEGHQNTA
jgi:hypothetical protein